MNILIHSQRLCVSAFDLYSANKNPVNPANSVNPDSPIQQIKPSTVHRQACADSYRHPPKTEYYKYMNYNNKTFKPISNSENGEVDAETQFHYQQEGNILTCTYSGNEIKTGHLIGLVDENGNINMRYHQVNRKGELMTGICKSTPKVVNGKLQLHESWAWTSGDLSKGNSILEEVVDK